MHVDPDALHTDVKSKLRKILMEEGKGEICPTCEQHVQIYRRHINGGMVRAIVRIWRVSPRDWVDITALPADSREEGKFVYWGLLEEQQGRLVAGTRKGMWRLTDRGRLYVENRLAVPYTALVYDGRCLGLEGKTLKISEVRSKKFNYYDLMAGR